MSSEGGPDPSLNVLLFRDVPPSLQLSTADKRDLKAFARRLSEKTAGYRSFTCLITNDRTLQQLNRHFLDHDYPTDVLSFPGGGSAELGEMAISIERAAEQAASFGHPCLEEIRILMLHAVLHLLGYDHEHDRGEMARAERKWRQTFQLPSTLLARDRAASGARAR